jgi:hypothetical protein
MRKESSVGWACAKTTNDSKDPAAKQNPIAKRKVGLGSMRMMSFKTVVGQSTRAPHDGQENGALSPQLEGAPECRVNRLLQCDRDAIRLSW